MWQELEQDLCIQPAFTQLLHTSECKTRVGMLAVEVLLRCTSSHFSEKAVVFSLPQHPGYIQLVSRYVYRKPVTSNNVTWYLLILKRFPRCFSFFQRSRYPEIHIALFQALKKKSKIKAKHLWWGKEGERVFSCGGKGKVVTLMLPTASFMAALPNQSQKAILLWT